MMRCAVYNMSLQNCYKATEKVTKKNCHRKKCQIVLASIKTHSMCRIPFRCTFCIVVISSFERGCLIKLIRLSPGPGKDSAGQYFCSTRDVANIDIIDPHEQRTCCYPVYTLSYYNQSTISIQLGFAGFSYFCATNL